MNRRLLISLVLARLILVPLLLVLAGCDAPPPAPPPERLTLAVPRTTVTTLVVVAQARGFFRAAGLEVTLIPTEVGGEAMGLLGTGQADGAVVSETVFAIDALKNPDLRLVAAIDQVDYFRCVVRADRGIHTPADLKGRRIGYLAGTASEYYTDLYLRRHDLDHDQVTLVPLERGQVRDVFAEERADAVFTWNISAWELAAGAVPTRVWPAQEDYPLVDVVVVPRVLTEQRPAALRRLVQALTAAEASVAQDPRGAQETLARWTGFSLEAIQGTWGDHDFSVTLDRSLMLGLEDAARWLIRNRRTPATTVPNFLDLIAFTPLESVRPESVSIVR